MSQQDHDHYAALSSDGAATPAHAAAAPPPGPVPTTAGKKKDKKPKDRRPPNTAFHQQRLRAFHPIITPTSVLSLFLALGVIFAPLGGLMLWADTKVQEVVIDYSTCDTDAPVYPSYEFLPGSQVASSFKNGRKSQAQWTRRDDVPVTFASGAKGNTTRCTLIFTVPNDMGNPVFMYYRLNNFYQNHRRYTPSFDKDQLAGKAVDNKTMSGSTCDPLRTDPEYKKPYYPCGIIANSIFNDTIYEPVKLLSGGKNETYHMTKKGIAWASDRTLIKPTKYTWDQVVPPPNWRVQYPDMYTADAPPPNLQENEDFHVWMRTAGLPLFSKLYRKNENETMTSGVYSLDVDQFFPVTPYDGNKYVVFTTRTVMGGKNNFQGIAYIVAAGLCTALGIFFLVGRLLKPRPLGDPKYLSWNKVPPSGDGTPGGGER